MVDFRFHGKHVPLRTRGTQKIEDLRRTIVRKLQGWRRHFCSGKYDDPIEAARIHDIVTKALTDIKSGRRWWEFWK